jgi:nitrogen fixation protein NifU and related proteins
MPSLSELYQNVILEHNRSPRNYRAMDDANREAQGHNPLCGDQVTVRLRVADGRIQDAAFQGSGCAISRASASLMTSAIKGQTPEAAAELFHRFHRLVTGHPEAEKPETLGKLAVFSGVSEYPSRVKCASLPWHTMKAALDRGAGPTMSPSPDL